MRLFYHEKCYDNLFDYLQYLFIVTLNGSLNELIFSLSWINFLCILLLMEEQATGAITWEGPHNIS